MTEPEGWDRPGRSRAARVRFTDGSWRSATMLGWRHREDSWFAHIQWPGGLSEWLAYDPRYIRPELPARRPAAGAGAGAAARPAAAVPEPGPRELAAGGPGR